MCNKLDIIFLKLCFKINLHFLEKRNKDSEKQMKTVLEISAVTTTTSTAPSMNLRVIEEGNGNGNDSHSDQGIPRLTPVNSRCPLNADSADASS